MFVIAGFFGVIAIISFYLIVKNVEERVVHVAVVEKQNQLKENFSYLKTVKNFVKNRAIIGLSFVALFLTIFIMGASQLNTILINYIFGTAPSLLIPC